MPYVDVYARTRDVGGSVETLGSMLLFCLFLVQ
jgi:hypothetical protein